MQLPAELIDYIFSFLQKDRLALKACSEAHSLYSRLAERHLYAGIVVDDTTVLGLHKLLSENPRFLDYPRTLDFRGDLYVNPQLLSIMPMIPRMAHLMTLRIHLLLAYQYEESADFFSAFRICLQQSSIEKLDLSFLYDFPLSVLDSGKNIKKLVLSSCTAQEGEPIASLPSSQQSLQTLVLSGDHNPCLHFWAMRRITHLTSLGLRGLALDLDCSTFPGLLKACHNSLTRFHLDLGPYCASTYFFEDVSHWINDLLDPIPFTLSALGHLEDLSILSQITSTTTSMDCALPAIIRLIKTAPAIIREVNLHFHYYVSDSLSSLGRLDWSHLQSSARTHPHINLFITAGEDATDPSFSPESILDALAGSRVLMHLVERGLVSLKSEPAAPFVWED